MYKVKSEAILQKHAELKAFIDEESKSIDREAREISSQRGYSTDKEERLRLFLLTDNATYQTALKEFEYIAQYVEEISIIEEVTTAEKVEATYGNVEN